MRKYIVAYSYQDKFEIDEKEAAALITAKEQNMAGIRSGDKYLTTNFMWIMSKEEVEPVELDSAGLKLCENVADWLSRDVHELSWNYQSALDYSKKLMRRIGHQEVKKLWNTYANGSYPSAKKFLMEAKQASSLETPVDTSHLLE